MILKVICPCCGFIVDVDTDAPSGSVLFDGFDANIEFGSALKGGENDDGE